MLKRFAQLATIVATFMMLAAPAYAHNLTVTPPGTDREVHNWVGALNIPGQGKGLIAGGPGGAWTLTPAHAKGLNTACGSLEGNPSVVDIRGPAGPGCPHGS